MAIYKGQGAVDAIRGLVGDPVVVKINDDISVELTPPRVTAVEGIRKKILDLGVEGQQITSMSFLVMDIVVEALQVCIEGLTEADAFALFNRYLTVKSDVVYRSLSLCGLEPWARTLRDGKDSRDKEDKDDPKIST